MSIVPIPPYVPPYAPIPTVQPFTYRDGVTYWEKLNGIVKYVNRVILPYVNEHINDFGEEFANEINALIQQVNDAINLVINNSIEVQDPVVEGIINDLDSLTRVALDALYVNKTDFNEYSSNVADSINEIKTDYTKKIDVPSYAVNRKKKAVFFGDSWTTILNSTLISRVSSLMNFDSTNYGLSNSAFNSGPVTIESQLIIAGADESVNKNLVEYVIVICGTNNVFWNREFTFGGIAAFFNSVRTLYPNAEIYFIPENANDYNGGRTYQYNTMMLGAQYAGVKVADWALWMMWYNFGAFYQGTDDNGRQHLTQGGYDQFGSWIASWIKGTDISNMGVKIKFSPVLDSANSTITFSAGHSMADSYSDRSYIKNGIVVQDIELTNLTFVSGQNVPTLRLIGSLEPWAPINNNAGGSNVIGGGYAGSAYTVDTNLVPNSTNGYTIFTLWRGSGVFTNVRLRNEYSLLGALP